MLSHCLFKYLFYFMLLLPLKWQHFHSTDISCLTWVSCSNLTTGIKEVQACHMHRRGRIETLTRVLTMSPFCLFCHQYFFPLFSTHAEYAASSPREKTPQTGRRCSVRAHWDLPRFHAGPYSAWVGILAPPAKLSPMRGLQSYAHGTPATHWTILYTRTAPGIFCWERVLGKL